MKSDEILSICESVLVEGHETPKAAVLAVERMCLTITIQELQSKGEGFLRTADRMRGELEKLEKEARDELADSEIDF